MAVRIESQAEPIPGYKLLERLGGGGFGEVWKAIAPGGLLKAIKFVYGDLELHNDDGQQRAEQELKALSRVKTVRHPYILSLERYDIVDGQLMIVMELADRNLWDRFRECRSHNLTGIPREEILRYMEESAEALDLMNIEYQLQHLDIKPQNIFLVHNHIKVADFGLVKDLEGMSASVTGGVTPVYAAPETFDGWVSRYCDQYSLAIVYQELLTGQRPFNGTNVRQLILQHLQGTPNLEPLPACDRESVARALAKSPDSRFPTCQAFVATLRAAEDGGSAPGGWSGSPAAQGSTPAGAGTTAEAPAGGSGRPETKLGVADSGLAIAQPINRLRPPTRVAAAAEEGGPRSRVQEVRGEGVFFPAVVIGLGFVGLSVLQRLHASLEDRLVALESLPHLRLLYLDTDPECPRLATTAKFGKALSMDEVVLARLNRPSHYLRSRDARIHIETWLNSKMLYRIPRNLVTTGMRSLGRLAFCDNQRMISRRLRVELECCTNPEALTVANRHTHLGTRTNWPRVYVIAGLAGGTGSGMFLDVAYVTRSLLKKLGYENPDLVGVLLLPPVDRNPARTLALGNVYAALTELNHFSITGTTFAARYDDQDSRITDPEAPFSRTIVLTLPEGAEEAPLGEMAGFVADVLYRDLVTPLGREADRGRAEIPAPARSPRAVFYQTLGSYRFSWPRRALMQRAGRLLCKKLVQRWATKDSTPIRDTVKTWTAEQWSRQQLAAETLIERLQAACEKSLGQVPENAFAAITEPLTSFNTHAPEQHLPAIRAALKQLEELVGRPEGSTGGRGTAIKETLDDAANALVADWGQRLAELAVRLIEQPEYRLAGAEEAIRQFVATIEQVLEHYEPLVKEMGARVADAYGRITGLLTNNPELAQGGRRAATLVSNVVDIVRLYPKWRYQSLILHRVTATYVSLRGYLSDQVRDINFCRNRLVDLQRNFDDPVVRSTASADPRRCRNFFPTGCRNLDDAVDQFMQNVSVADLQDLDGRVQRVIQEQFTALVYVCLTSANLVRNLEVSMQHEAEAFVGERLGSVNVAEMFLDHYADEDDAMHVITEAYQAAAPEHPSSTGPAPNEFCIIAVPEGPAGSMFFELARRALPDVQFQEANSPDDIVFYRELPHLSLSSLEHLGPLGHEAYRQMISLEHFTPHSRMDVKEWRSPGS